MTEYPHVPAAFINAIREEGTKAEACDWLQKTWNELCAVRRSGNGVDVAPLPDKANGVKVGDTVRVLRARNAYGQDVYAFSSKPFAVGETFVVGRLDDENTSYPCPVAFPEGEGVDFWRIDDLETLSTSPAIADEVGEDKLRAALELIYKGYADGETFSGRYCSEIAGEALGLGEGQS